MLAVSLDPNTFIFYLGNGPELNGRLAYSEIVTPVSELACACAFVCTTVNVSRAS